MMWALGTAFVVGAVQVVLAAPGIPPRPQLFERQNQNGTAPTAPCGTVSASAAAALATAPNVRPIIDAQLAVDCLNSVPLRAKEAVELVDAIRPYMEWQSDSAYLKSPPADYPFPAVDLFGTLDAVKANITTGKYQNEVQFQTALFNTFTQAHDGHFVFFPDALTKGFAFRRQVALVSISSDGIEIPKIYVYNDTIAASQTGSTFKASAVTKINDVEASRFLQDLVNPSTPLQDQDAGYNAMFFSKASVAGLGGNGFFQAGGPGSFMFPGATTTLTFENGTTVTMKNTASVRSSFAGVTDGDTYYKKFCTGPPPSATTPAPVPPGMPGTNVTSSVLPTSTSRPPPVPSAPGYPQPVILSSDGIISGYFLDDTTPGADNVAVLSVLSFELDSPAEFQSVAQRFFSMAKAAGKTKLIVDLQVNGGGFLFLGYELFRQLMPGIAQDGFTRLRLNSGLLKAAEVFTGSVPGDFSRANLATANDTQIQNFENFYNYKFDLDIANSTFTNFDAKFKGKMDKGDSFSNLIRWDMSDQIVTSNTTYGLGINITGYGNLTNSVQPFKAEDIMMVYDGFCASTCTVFSEFMRLQAGVKSIAFGGRPSNTAIQAIGGVKGSQSYGFENIYGDMQRALEIQKNASQPLAAELQVYSDLPMNRSIAAGVNLRDNILPMNLGDGVPAQFVQEKADCRLYWTSAMIGDVREVWRAAAKAAWGGGPCVAGSLPQTQKNAVVNQAGTTGKSGPSRTELLRSEIVRSGVVLEKDDAWDVRHGTKVNYYSGL